MASHTVDLNGQNPQPSKHLQAFMDELHTLTIALNSYTSSELRNRVQASQSNILQETSQHIQPGDFLLTHSRGDKPSDCDYDTRDSESENNYCSSDTDDDAESMHAEEDVAGFVGEGEFVVGNKLIRISDWLGDEYTDRINALHNAKPLQLHEFRGLRTELREWQRSAVSKINICCQGPNRGCIFGDEMGLGKSLATMVSCMASKDTTQGSFDLIVTTKTCMPQWRDEAIGHFEEMYRPKVLLLKDPKTTAIEVLDGGYDFVICSYQFLQAQHRALLRYHRFFEKMLKGNQEKAKVDTKERHQKRPILSLFSPIYRDLKRPIRHLILDEVQYVKKPTGAIHLAIKDLYYSSVIMLSGTFLANRWSDCFGLLDFLPGHPFKTLQEFNRVFGARSGNKWGNPSVTKQQRLVKFLMAFTIARPSSLLELPGLVVDTAPFRLTDSEANEVLYHTKKFFVMLKIGSKSPGNGGDLTTNDKKRGALASATRAQQHAASPFLVEQKSRNDIAKIRKDCISLRKKFEEQVHHGIVDEKSSVRALVSFLESTASKGGNKDSKDYGDDEDDEDDEDSVDNEDLDDDNSEDSDNSADDGETLLTIRTGKDRLQWLEKVRKLPDSNLQSSRVQAFLRLYYSIRCDSPNDKIVVFSKFLKFLDLLEEALRREGILALRFDGTKSDQDRILIKRQFRECTAQVPLLITPGSGGAGMNLSTGSKLIQCEVWWNGNDEKQAYGRLYHQRQEKTVHVWVLEATNSAIDFHVQTVRDRKTVVNNKLLLPLRRTDHEPPIVPYISKYY